MLRMGMGPDSYGLTDGTYARLLERITRDQTLKVPSGLKQDILAYYADQTARIATKRDPAQWAAVRSELVTLQTLPTIPEP